MMRRLVCAAVAVACVASAMPAAAQSLAEVARQEEARRKTARKAVRSLSNADLAPSEIAAPAAAAAEPAGCITSIKEGKCVEPEKVAANSQGEGTPADPQVKTSESTVRQEANLIRQRLLKAQKEFEVISATADDPSRSPGERAAAARMATQRESMLASIADQWRALERQVADEELPREWLDPIPLLPSRTPQ
jgi:hypothetical protein